MTSGQERNSLSFLKRITRLKPEGTGYTLVFPGEYPRKHCQIQFQTRVGFCFTARGGKTFECCPTCSAQAKGGNRGRRGFRHPAQSAAILEFLRTVWSVCKKSPTFLSGPDQFEEGPCRP